MHLGASIDDWHSGTPKVKPVLWFVSIVGMAAIAIAIAAWIGSYLNGDGSPFLS
jgi:hypothetical protein